MVNPEILELQESQKLSQKQMRELSSELQILQKLIKDEFNQFREILQAKDVVAAEAALNIKLLAAKTALELKRVAEEAAEELRITTINFFKLAKERLLDV